MTPSPHKFLEGLEAFLINAEKQIIFHGAGIPNLRTFRPAVNETFGRGLYLSSDRERAESYAVFRTGTKYGGECDPEDIPKGGFQATCYVFEATGHYLDLRTNEAMETLLPLWKTYLTENREQILEDAQNNYLPANNDWKKLMASGFASELSEVLTRQGKINRYAFMEPQSYLNNVFSQFLERAGYDGLIAIEGNEKDGKYETKKGDSWVVFDSNKLVFVEEYECKKDTITLSS
ncbi:MAG: hypothetical protein WC254_07330 [Candidatus Woesearchaeota archaeon]|jgi:hypothetical protein